MPSFDFRLGRFVHAWVNNGHAGASRRRGMSWCALSSLLVVFALAQAACAQAPSSPGKKAYVPEVGQAGKDVEWVPTSQELVDMMLDMAKATPKDYLIDLGSGDGRTVITAARRGIRAHGIEYNPDMVALAKAKAAEAGVADRATFAKEDLFKSDFSKATVITMFLLEDINEELRPNLLQLNPGTRIVSNSFTMGEWTPDEKGRPAGCVGWCTALMWIVPARVEGNWSVGELELSLTQNYQFVQGTLGSRDISNGRLRGSEFSFTVDGVKYAGTVAGDRMTVARVGLAEAWTAERR